MFENPRTKPLLKRAIKTLKKNRILYRHLKYTLITFSLNTLEFKGGPWRCRRTRKLHVIFNCFWQFVQYFSYTFYFVCIQKCAYFKYFYPGKRHKKTSYNKKKNVPDRKSILIITIMVLVLKSKKKTKTFSLYASI